MLLVDDDIIDQYKLLWEHQSSRSIWELENICMKGKCVICKRFGQG